MISLAASPLWAAEIKLTSSTELSSEGYFVLHWEPAVDSDTFSPSDEFALLRADNPDMLQANLRQKLPLQGAVTVSGLGDGQHYFRVDAPGLSSNVVLVEVKHHSLTRAFTFFSIGLLLFLVLGTTIYLGHKIHRTSIA